MQVQPGLEGTRERLYRGIERSEAAVLFAERMDDRVPGIHIIGVYGPAECVASVTVQANYSKVDSPANIGYPYAGACWVVDGHDHQMLVPTSAVGELVVQGPGLSEGYVNDPEQTAKSYISNLAWLPGAKEDETKLYKTGDLVRCLPDGSLHFIGRKDTQVIVNGQRIELGEVEHHMRVVLGDNQEVIVEAVRAGKPSSCLVAFIAPGNKAQSSTDLFLAPDVGFKDRVHSIKSQLHGRLPRYMVPETCVFVSHIPATMTGKLDRRLLRELFTLLPRALIKTYFGLENKETSMPVTKKEEKMQRLWANVLDLDMEEVSRDDDWISLGGNSLVAMQLVPLARQEQFFLSVPDIFRHRTISALCQNMKTDVTEMVEEVSAFALLSDDHELKNDQMLHTIADQCQVSPDSIEDAYPCTSLQLDASLVPIQVGYNYTLQLEFKLPSAVDLDQLSRAWDMTVASNPILRTRIIELTKDNYIQAVLRESIPLDTLDSSNKARYEPAVDVWGLGKPLVRACLQNDQFIMLIHHAIYDGQSLPLLFRDISNAYQGQELTPNHFAPLVRWSKDLSASKRQFWTEKFASFDGKLFPPVLDPSLEPVESRELTGHLNIVHDAFTPTNKIRLTMAIVASWHLGANDIVFGAVYARRSAPILNIIESAAPTTAMLPDRVTLDAEQTPRQNLDRDQDNALSLMSYEGIDDRDIEHLSPECEAACLYGTLLAVQPDLTKAYPEMFQEKDMHYYGPICALNSLLQCYLSSETATISLRLSESTMKGTYCWEKFIDEFQAVFHFIQECPDVKLCDVRSQLDISSSCS